jgi:hypothetical protein
MLSQILSICKILEDSKTFHSLKTYPGSALQNAMDSAYNHTKEEAYNYFLTNWKPGLPTKTEGH